jgi:polyvinyl alcohol dehydrogenase (cytochrome)
MRQLLHLAWRLIWLVAFCQVVSVTARPSEEPEPKPSQEDLGERLYQDNCAKCHDNKSSGAPHRSSIGYLTPASIYDALTTGRMRTQAARLSDQERHQVAEFVSDDKLSDAQSRPLMMCKAKAGWFGSRKGSGGADGGMDPKNTRLLPAAQAGISAADLHNLRLQWAFAFPQVSRAVSEPLVTGGGLFVGSENGVVYALDAKSGCVHWTFNAGAEVVSGIVSYDNRVLIFGDRLARIYGISADTGTLIWQAKVEDHPSATIASAPALMGDRVYVPISSIEESAADPKDGCCTFRGSVVALNAATGDKVGSVIRFPIHWPNDPKMPWACLSSVPRVRVCG